MALIDRFRRLTARDTSRRDATKGDATAHEPAAQPPRDQPARAPVTVGAFIDEQSFRLAQACVQDYARLRAGEGADALVADPSFARALDKACWEGYPRALAMVGMVVDNALRPHAADDLNMLHAGVAATILETFDRRPVPSAIGDVDWHAARTDLERSLGELSQLRPKSADAVAEDHSTFYLAIMPLHPKLGADDFPTLRNQLKRSLAQAQEAFLQWANLPALSRELIARVPSVDANEAPATSP